MVPADFKLSSQRTNISWALGIGRVSCGRWFRSRLCCTPDQRGVQRYIYVILWSHKALYLWPRTRMTIIHEVDQPLLLHLVFALRFSVRNRHLTSEYIPSIPEQNTRHSFLSRKDFERVLTGRGVHLLYWIVLSIILQHLSRMNNGEFTALLQSIKTWLESYRRSIYRCWRQMKGMQYLGIFIRALTIIHQYTTKASLVWEPWATLTTSLYQYQDSWD